VRLSGSRLKFWEPARNDILGGNIPICLVNSRTTGNFFSHIGGREARWLTRPSFRVATRGAWWNGRIEKEEKTTNGGERILRGHATRVLKENRASAIKQRRAEAEKRQSS